MIEEEALRLAEALVFASATPIGARALSQLLPEHVDADAVLVALRARYASGARTAALELPSWTDTARDVAAALQRFATRDAPPALS